MNNIQQARLDLRQQFVVAITSGTIYPNGVDGGFALGSPDGRILHDGEMVEIRLGGLAIVGFIEHPAHSIARFVAEDGSACGLCAGMWIGVLSLQLVPLRE